MLIFKRSKAGLNSEFFFSKAGCQINAKGPSLPDYLPIAGEREQIILFLSQRALVQIET